MSFPGSYLRRETLMASCQSRFVSGRREMFAAGCLSARAGKQVGGGARALEHSVEHLEQRMLLSFSWTAEEVYLTELVNRARANPQAEAQRLSVDLTAGLTSAELARYHAQEPLALNEYLTTAARAHSLDMATRNFFDHINPSGQNPTQRAQAAGYGGTAGENIAAGYASVDAAHLAWMQSLGHRKNVLSLHSTFDSSFHYDEFGPGMAMNAGGTYGNYFTQEFGYPGATHIQYVLGVVFNDADNNDFYGIGEGASGIRIDVATTAAPNTVVGTYTTDAAGNYQILLGDGSYLVTFTRLSDGYKVQKSVTMAGENKKVDAETNELQDPAPPPPPPPPPPPADDYANAGQWAQAGNITVDPNTGNAATFGSLEVGGDTDLFKYVATRTGTATILIASPTSSFSMQLRAYNASLGQISLGSPAGPGNTGSQVTIQVVQGQTYYLLAAGANGSATGLYVVSIEGPGLPPPPPPTPDDYADAGEWSGAASITIDSSTGNGSITGELESAGDTDLFKFTATRTGLVTIGLANGSGQFAALFTAFGSGGTQLVQGTPGGGTNNGSTGQFLVVSGQTYYLLAAAANGAATGTYMLSITGPTVAPPQDDAADAGEWSLASTLTLNSSGGAFRAGYFETEGDTDLFKFTATASRTIQLTLQNPQGAYAAFVRVYGSDFALLGSGHAGGAQSLGSVLEVSVTAGQTYYVLASAVNGSATGLYTLDLATLSEPAPPPVVVDQGDLAAWYSAVTTSFINGRLTLSFMSQWNHPIVATQQSDGSWQYVDLLDDLPGMTEITGQIEQWVDGRDDKSYMALRSADGLIILREDQPGSWTSRNITEELSNGQVISEDMTIYLDKQRRMNVVGVNSVGDIVMYCQKVRPSPNGGWKWKFRNLTASDLERVNQEMPLIASEVDAWVMPDSGDMHITFLDVDGNIQQFSRGMADRNWRLENISQSVNIAPLVGELDVMMLRNGTIQIMGTSEDGHIWAMRYRERDGWTPRDLTGRFRGPDIQIRSVSTYLKKGGAGFVAGITESGSVRVFRYIPWKNRWKLMPLELRPPDLHVMVGQLQTTLDEVTGNIHIVGTLENSRVVKWSWQRDLGWSFEDVSYEIATA